MFVMSKVLNVFLVRGGLAFFLISVKLNLIAKLRFPNLYPCPTVNLPNFFNDGL